MNNNSDRITANEINKFSYCPYQFYYERLHGQKKIRQIRSKTLQKKGYKDKAKSNFKKGLDFHENYDTSQIRNYPVFKLIVLVIVLVIGISFYDQLFVLINYIFEFISST